MSGTSVDGIDAALVFIDGNEVALEATVEYPIPEATRQAIAAISHSSADEIERMGLLDRDLGVLFARAAQALLQQAEREPQDVVALGSHGQTIRHRPPEAGDNAERGFTVQIGDPNTIAEFTGITTVADFRRRDMAAGGQGAPLAPAFHAAAFGRSGRHRAVVNIGGIANVSLLRGDTLVAGFDTGPGNTLLDQWIQRHRGEPFDRDGAWAASGQVHEELLARLLSHPYFTRRGPRSTGKEDFHLPWLESALAACPGISAADVQSTLAELTARSIAAGIESDDFTVHEVYLSGGGAYNSDLADRLRARLPAALTLDSCAVLGLDPDWVEAAAFAWLASRTLAGLAGNAPAVTGAAGERILGGIYPGQAAGT